MRLFQRRTALASRVHAMVVLLCAGTFASALDTDKKQTNEMDALRQALGSKDSNESGRAAARLYTIGHDALAPLQTWSESKNAVLADRAQELRQELLLRLRWPPVVQEASFAAEAGRVLITSYQVNSCVWLKDVNTGVNLLYLRKTQPRVSRTALSNDGRFAACGGFLHGTPPGPSPFGDYSVALWDCDSGLVVRRFSGHTEGVSAVALSKDGKFLVSSSWDGTARVWEIETGKEVTKFSGHTGRVGHAAISPDGSLVATCGEDQAVRLWKRDTGREVGRLNQLRVSRSCFSPDGKHLVTAGGRPTVKDNQRVVLDGAVKLWDLESKKELHALGGQDEQVQHLAFDATGKYVLTADDYTAHYWEVETGRKLGTHSLRPASVGGAGFAGDGKQAIIVRRDGELIRWKLPAP